MDSAKEHGMKRRGQGFILVVSAILLMGLAAPASAAYTVNGQKVAPEMQELMAFHGYKPGNYYIDNFGNYGQSGQPPSGNINGGPPQNWSGVEPSGTAGNPYAQAYVNGVTGVRVFWVYSPSIFSGATGGASGYVHICPNNVFHRSAESAINVGGEYDSQRGGNKPWGGVAGTSQSSGRWTIEKSPNGPLLALYGPDGGVQRVALQTMLQGRWKFGQTKYAAESGKASCP